jgi:ABC-type Mn2+/Zn2+ transport system permease subunit
MKILIEMLSYPFLVRALMVGVLVSLCAALLGTSLVLKRYSMIGDGLSHVGFAALACAYPFGFSPLYISIPVCITAAFFLLQLKDSSKIKGDAATALMCSGALAVGIMVISLTTGMNTDVCNYLFGSILAMSSSDLYLSIVLGIAVLTLYVLFFNRIFAVTFDETFAGATGVNVRLYNMVIAILTAVTVVLGMRMMGTLLISSLIVFPSLTAMRVTRKFKVTVILSAFLAVFCFMTGLVFSYLHAVPTGACIVVTNIILFLLFFIVEKVKEGRGCS